MKINSKRNRLILVVVILFLAIFSLNFFEKEVKGFFYFSSSPVQRFFGSLGANISNFLYVVSNSNSLKSEEEILKQKNEELIAKIAELNSIEKENQDLRNALGIEMQKIFKTILGQIISKDISEDSIIIDKGSDDGVREKMPVITSSKALVGRVGEVYKNYSRVILISNKNLSFDSGIAGKDITGIVRGSGNLKLYLDLVPKDNELSTGDVVISKSMGGIFPEGLIVGRIEKVNKNDTESFQKADIKLEFNLSELNNLFIITTIGL